METKIDEMARIELLGRLGFSNAALQLKTLSDRKRKLAIAHEFYRFVTAEKVAAFQEKLKKNTGKNMDDPYQRSYQTLAFTSVEHYNEVPPDQALWKLEEADNRKCFDSFEVAHIENVKDPILFGRIEGCGKRFYIAQWDDDVKIEDILMPTEG